MKLKIIASTLTKRKRRFQDIDAYKKDARTIKGFRAYIFQKCMQWSKYFYIKIPVVVVRLNNPVCLLFVNAGDDEQM